MIIKNNWHANGKLLLTGEYLVMEGAQALALPLKLGQSLSAAENDTGTLNWKALKPDGLWFEAKYNIPYPDLLTTDDEILGTKLESILKAAFLQKSDRIETGFDIITKLDFDPDLGFGSSSSLIYGLSKWLEIDPYELLANTFGGSGYDIACAGNNKPLFYQKTNNEIQISSVSFYPSFIDNIYFVYLNKKQSSSDSIAEFRKNYKYNKHDIDLISEISKKIALCTKQSDFEDLLVDHERIMSKILSQTPVKEKLFKTHNGTVKSLGAWGGDMVLITRNEPEDQFYFQLSEKGFDNVFRYNELVFNTNLK